MNYTYFFKGHTHFQVDAVGPRARLKNLLFNQKTLLTIAEWVTVSWLPFIPVSFNVIISVFMYKFIDICSFQNKLLGLWTKKKICSHKMVIFGVNFTPWNITAVSDSFP